jgi:hypothetical protein
MSTKMRRVFSILAVAPVIVFSMATAVAEKKGKAATDGEEPKEDVRLVDKACGTSKAEVHFNSGTDKKQHPTPEPPAGKAMVFVVRPTMLGNKIQTKLAVDGDWKGANRGNNYFFFEMDPGEHYVCSKAENRSTLVWKAEAGKTYYLQQKVQMGMMKARNSVKELDAADGQKALAKCHLSTAKPKTP